ncbi:unnamed protein product [Linum tenue]|uniref:Fe2OG dioxygenase domain-containing protein n=1 Tax=Linum tenue TaxID=586396 RepID=A0AAV0K8J8_9ROSI|nr:unnamed protein product [Linum tenue]
MSKLVSDSHADGDELAKLHSACRDWGFFQVINHGVANTMMMKMNADIQEFFNQSLHEKMATLDQYSTELEKLTSSLLSSMARNLGLEPGKLLSLFKEGMQGMRMNYYPPCKQATKVIGLAPHSDATGLTLLAQVNEVQGLQIKRDGKWIPIDPIPGAFIVNVGDIIEIMSNGEYKSIEHRAVVNPEKERLSIATFHSPNFSATIGPLSNLLTKDKKGQAPNYKSISHEDYLKLGAKIKLDGKGKGLIHQMKIQPEALNGEK